MRNTKVLITGASSGIGFSTAKLLAEFGMIVFAGVRKNEDIKKINKLNLNIFPLILNIESDDDINKAFCFIKEKLIHEDTFILINNAGISKISPIEAITRDEWNHILNINIVSQMCMVKKFLPLFRRFNGKIINISSTSGLVAWPFAGAYAASKFALEGANDSLRAELRPYDIPVVIINPGSIKTEIWNKISDQVKNTIPLNLQAYYAGRLSMTLKLIQKGVSKNAVDAILVSKIIQKIILKKNPRRRYLVGNSAYLQYYLKKIFSEKLYDFIKYYFPENEFNKIKDYSGEKYLLIEELGENVDMVFCRIEKNTMNKKFFLRSHSLGDGMSSLKKIFSEQENLTIKNIPLAKSINKPSRLQRIKLMFKHYKRITGLNLNWKFYEKRHIEPFGFSFLFFSYTESKEIMTYCKSNKVTPTSLFLWCLDQASNELLLNDSVERAWLLPVNIRDNESTIQKDINLTSSITLRIKNDDSYVDIHNQIHQLYTEGIQYGAWILSNITKYFSRKRTKNLIANAKLSWVGVFSNVGNFSQKLFVEDINHDVRWIAGPPATSLVPITTALMSWDDQIGLSLQVHPSVINEFSESNLLLDKVRTNLLSKVNSIELQGEIHNFNWNEIQKNYSRF